MDHDDMKIQLAAALAIRHYQCGETAQESINNAVQDVQESCRNGKLGIDWRRHAERHFTQ